MGFILCKSYVTPTFFKRCTFRRCIRYFPLVIIYSTGVGSDLGRNYSDIYSNGYPTETYIRRFRWRSERRMNALCTFNLGRVSTWISFVTLGN